MLNISELEQNSAKMQVFIVVIWIWRQVKWVFLAGITSYVMDSEIGKIGVTLIV